MRVLIQWNTLPRKRRAGNGARRAFRRSDGSRQGVARQTGRTGGKQAINERRAGMASDTPMTDTAHELLGKHGKVSVYRMETLERAYNEMTRRTLAYEAAIRSTLKEQAHLADGDNCTLARLKRALRDNAIDGTADNTPDRGYETLAAIYKRRAVEFDSCLRILQQARDTLTGAGTDGLHAQADVDISGAAGSVKK